MLKMSRASMYCMGILWISSVWGRLSTGAAAAGPGAGFSGASGWGEITYSPPDSFSK